MGRTWMIRGKKGDLEYDAGLAEFYDFVRKNVKDKSSMACPCDMCRNIRYMSFEDVRIHLEKTNFNPKYSRWIFHGESKNIDIMEENVDVQFGEIQRETWLSDDEDPDESNSSLEGSGCDMNFELGDGRDDMSDKSWGDVFRGDEQEGSIYENFDEDIPDETDEDPDETDLEDTSVVLEKLKDSEMPLYSSCKHSKLAAIVKLYNLKATNGWSDKSFTDLLELLKDMLPEDNVLPNRTYEAKKILRGIGMKYEKIHACPNDCILYRKDYANLTSCPVCKEWRYKKKEGIPAKVLWYFPIIPRLIRLFANKEDAKLLTWHRTSKANDGKLRHPADGIDWKFIDEKYPEFGKESRNLRLALSTDGMNPFGNLSSQHSTWPVFLAIYNLPPYLCMKRKYLMLSLLISGPKEPGNDIDVYLEPLLDDLRLLWDKGIQVFDAYQNSYFNLKAMLLCTISDFPAYGNLCGHTVHGKEACPLCGEDVDSCYLKFSRKQAYTGYRRFLEHDHSYRRQQKAFNGKPEHRPPPKILTGHEVYQRVKDIKITYGKKGSKLASRGYKKMSPLFEKLPYWRDLSIRHCLDVMHIEKNVCDNIINTLLNVPNKSKDNTAARKDMVDMKIRPELAPQDKGTRSYLPPAAHTLSRKEKIEFCECLRGVKVPEGYSSNISTLVSMKDLRLIGLKSHDCHTLMQQLLVVAIRSILPKKVRYAITRFCFFFNAICNKVLDPTELESLQKLIVTSLCQLEMYFPPSFFTIMVHLTVHLVREIKYLGPVYLRYQYPFERLMKVYKDYTSNKYRPEGCIAERAITDEALSYCYTHLSNSELIGVPKNRHSEWMMGKGLRGHVRQDMTTEKWHIAHTYVLHNEDEVQPYIEEHMVSLREKHRNKTEKWIASEHNKTFRVWFKARVIEDLQQYPDCISSRLRRLCFGPKTFASSYSGYAIKGCTFYTREQDDMSTMQNSGVCVEAEAMHFASSKDKNPILSKMHYYGVIEEIWELDYTDFVIPIFGCKWIDNNNGVRKDELGFTLVNLGKFGHKEDPFIIGTQAKQVFYVTDPSDKKWSVALSVRCKPTLDSCDDDVVFEGFDPHVSRLDDTDIVGPSSLYTRDDHDEGIWIISESNSKKRPRSSDA